MSYRLLTVSIVLFWLGMTAMLLRTELFPDGAAQTPVPAAHVFKQMFLHEQMSDLALYRQRRWLGAFHLQPRRTSSYAASGATHALNLNGGSTLDFLGMPNQHMILRATFDLDDKQAVRHFEVLTTVREPRQKGDSLGINFDGFPPANRYHYLVRRGETVFKERTGSPEELLDDPDLRGFGFDPQALARQIFAQASGPVRMDARRATLPFNGDRIETYLITFHHGDTLETTVQTTQQGQVLAVTTFAAYDFYDETMTP